PRLQSRSTPEQEYKYSSKPKSSSRRQLCAKPRGGRGIRRGTLGDLAWNQSRFPRVKQHMRVISAATAAAAAAFVTAVGCNRNQGAAPAGMAFPPATVKLAAVAPTNIEDATEYVAMLKSLHSTTIQPQIEGQITQIYVKSGDHVTTGEPLLQID